MPTRSKTARHAALFGLAVFELLRRGHTRRRAGSAKGKGRALRDAPRGKRQKRKRLREYRRAHLGLASKSRALCRGLGGLGAAPPVLRSGGAVASPRLSLRTGKAERDAPAFLLSPAPRSGRQSVTVSVSTGASIRPRSRGFRAASLPPPPGGDAVGGGGVTFTPYGVPLPIPGQGRGKVGPLSGPIVAQMGYNRRSRRPR